MTEEFDAAHWERVREIYEKAIDLAGPARETFLAESCADDATLRSKVAELLRAYDNNPDLLETPLRLEVDPVDYDPTAQRLGPYRLVRRLGSGGMGVVYLAERDDGLFRFQVAVKIVWPQSPIHDLPARFARERQILADLNHPNISRLIDGGVTPEGLPYMVLEYIEGERINHYCEQHELSVDARLRLFREAGRAVAHAHERKVIHRDIKPANILVTSAGEVKLLDFGIARVLEGDEGSGDGRGERTSSPLLTYDYASPQQILGERVDAASDVYSLGVVLYQLIEGRLPYELPHNAPLLIIRTITEVEPPALVRGGGEWMNQQLTALIRRAMAKQVADRYPTVAALLEDLEKLLAGTSIADSEVSGRRVKRRTSHLLVVIALILAGGAGLLWKPLAAYYRERSNDELLVQSRELLKQGDFAGARRLLGSIEAGPAWLARSGVEYGNLRDKANLPAIISTPEVVDQSILTGEGRFLLTTSLDYSNLRVWETQTGKLVRELVPEDRKLWPDTHTDPRQALLVTAQGDSLIVKDLLTGEVTARCVEPGGELAGMIWYEGVITHDLSGVVKRWNLADCQAQTLLRLPPPSRKGIESRYNLPLILAKNDSSLAVWNLQTGRRLLELVPQPGPLPTGKIDNIEFDEQLRFGAFERLTNQVEVYSLESGRLVNKYQEPDSINKIIVDAAKGRLITLHDGGKAKIRQLSSPQIIREFDLREEISDGLCVDDGGLLLVATKKGRLALIDLREDRLPLLRQLHSEKSQIHLRYDQALRLLVTSGTDGTARIWPLDRLVEQSALLPQTDGWISSLARSPDGERLLVGARDNLVRIWNVATRRIEKKITGHTAWVLDVAYSPDGQLFSSASTDGLVKVWRAADGQLLHNLDHGIQVHAAIFSPDGETIASASSDGHLRLWETVSGRLRLDLAAHRGEATCVAWSPTQDLLVTGGYDGQVTFWDPGRGTEIGRLAHRSGKVWAMAFSPDGRTLGVIGADPQIRLIDVDSRQVRMSIPGAPDGGLDLAFTADGERLVYAGEDHSIRIFAVASGRELVRQVLGSGRVNALLLSADGQRLFTGSTENKVEILNTVWW